MKNTSMLSVSAALFGVLMLDAPAALAVHDLEEVFELENFTDGGDAIDDAAIPQDDWGTTVGCPGGLASCGYVAGPNAPGGNSLTSTFLNDVPPPGGFDNVFFGGGSKDDLDLTGWKWTTKTGVTDKDDIQQGGAAAYNYEGDSIVYFFQTLFAQNGDAAAGVWLLQDKVVPMVNAKGVGQFMEVDGAGNPVGVASHQIGDVFVSAKLSNGGTDVAMTVYTWVGPGNAADCPGGAAALAPPKKSLCIIETEADANCGTITPDPHTACGTMNLRPTESPDDWGYLGKSPPVPGPAWPPGTDGIDEGDFPATTFLEGGVNLTELGLSGCFSTFLLETRSSDSVRSELKDFTMGDFPLCGIKVTKLCSPLDPTGGVNPAVGPFGDSIITTFDILIENTGVATVYDVELEEDAIFGLGEYCEIYDTGQPLSTDSPIIVAAELIAGDAVPVTIQCETTGNPFFNAVTARAKSSDSLTDPDIEDSDALVGVEPGTPRAEGGACPANFNSGLTLFKDCEEDPTTLVLDASGRLQIDVGVYFTVTNTGQEKLLGIVLEDDKIGTINVGDLEPGEFWDSSERIGPMSYLADEPDGPGAGPWAPGDAYFMNTVEVTESTGALSGVDVGVGQTFDAKCYLCEPCPDCL